MDVAEYDELSDADLSSLNRLAVFLKRIGMLSLLLTHGSLAKPAIPTDPARADSHNRR